MTTIGLREVFNALANMTFYLLPFLFIAHIWIDQSGTIMIKLIKTDLCIFIYCLIAYAITKYGDEDH